MKKKAETRYGRSRLQTVHGLAPSRLAISPIALIDLSRVNECNCLCLLKNSSFLSNSQKLGDTKCLENKNVICGAL